MIIGITGNIKSGKSLLAQALYRQTRGTHQVRHIVEPLQLMMSSIGMPIYTQDDKDTLSWVSVTDEHKRLGFDNRDGYLTHRGFAEALGTPCLREIIGEDFFVQYLIIQNSTSNIIIDGIRYINEAEFIKNNKGIIITVEREGTEGGAHAAHILTVTRYHCNYHFDNKGTIADMESWAAQFVENVINE